MNLLQFIRISFIFKVRYKIYLFFLYFCLFNLLYVYLVFMKYFKQMISYIIEGDLIYVYIHIYFCFVYIRTSLFCISIFFHIYYPHTEIHEYDLAIYIPFLSIFVLLPLVCPLFSTFFTKIHVYSSLCTCYKTIL